MFADIIRSGVARGELPGQDPDLTAAALVGAISEILIGPLSHARDRGTDPGLVARICVLALRSVGDQSAMGRHELEEAP